MTHANAPMTPTGRLRLAKAIVEDGWSVRRAAERFQCSPATASRWAARYRANEPLTDRSCAPRRSPNRCPRRLERRIIALRFTRRWGPHRIGYHLGVPRATVGRVLARYRMPLLAHLDQATGLPVRKPAVTRYEAAVPGQLVHVDIKKLGRIPDGGGWRAYGRGSAQDRRAGVVRDRAARAGASGSRGYRYLHHAVDDHSRLAYSEILDDERKQTAAAFWTRARDYFAALGIEVSAVMTDNGRATGPTTLPQPWPPRTSSTGAHAPSDRRPTARWKGSTAPWQPNGPTPRSTPPRPLARPATANGSTTTTTTDPIPGSEAPSPQTAFTTSRGTTPSGAWPSSRWSASPASATSRRW